MSYIFQCSWWCLQWKHNPSDSTLHWFQMFGKFRQLGRPAAARSARLLMKIKLIILEIFHRNWYSFFKKKSGGNIKCAGYFSCSERSLPCSVVTFLLSMICTFLNVFEHCGTNVRLKRGDGFGADVTQVKLLLMRMRLAFGKLIVCPPPLSLLHSFPLQSFAKSELIPLENGSFSV